MKKLIIIFLFTPFISKSQDCDCKVISVSGGYKFNLMFDGGIQGDVFGIYGGVKLTTKTIAGNEIYPSSEQANVNPYIKLQVKIYGDGEDCLIRIYGVGYAGTGKIFGVGAKAAFIISNDWIIFAEPKFTELGKEADLGLSFRF